MEERKPFTREDFLKAKQTMEAANIGWEAWIAQVKMAVAKREMDKAAWVLELWMKRY